MFPASAGMNRPHTGDVVDVDHVPRERGDEPMAESAPFERLECSPRARG